MRSVRYLNGVLTIIAVLLTLNLWAQWHGGPGSNQLPAMPRAAAKGMPNPGAQRMEMIGQLKKLNEQVSVLTKQLETPIAVQVTKGKAKGEATASK